MELNAYIFNFKASMDYFLHTDMNKIIIKSFHSLQLPM